MPTAWCHLVFRWRYQFHGDDIVSSVAIDDIYRGTLISTIALPESAWILKDISAEEPEMPIKDVNS